MIIAASQIFIWPSATLSFQRAVFSRFILLLCHWSHLYCVLAAVAYYSVEKKCVTSYRHTAHAWLQFALYGRCAFKGKLNIDNILLRVSHVSREFSLYADVLIITANFILLWQCRWNQEREREKVLSTQDDFASWEIPGMQSHIARWPSARIQYQCKYDKCYFLFCLWSGAAITNSVVYQAQLTVDFVDMGGYTRPN